GQEGAEDRQQHQGGDGAVPRCRQQGHGQAQLDQGHDLRGDRWAGNPEGGEPGFGGGGMHQLGHARQDEDPGQDDGTRVADPGHARAYVSLAGSPGRGGAAAGNTAGGGAGAPPRGGGRGWGPARGGAAPRNTAGG